MIDIISEEYKLEDFYIQLKENIKLLHDSPLRNENTQLEIKKKFTLV